MQPFSIIAEPLPAAVANAQWAQSAVSDVTTLCGSMFAEGPTGPIDRFIFMGGEHRPPLQEAWRLMQTTGEIDTAYLDGIVRKALDEDPSAMDALRLLSSGRYFGFAVLAMEHAVVPKAFATKAYKEAVRELFSLEKSFLELGRILRNIDEERRLRLIQHFFGKKENGNIHLDPNDPEALPLLRDLFQLHYFLKRTWGFDKPYRSIFFPLWKFLYRRSKGKIFIPYSAKYPTLFGDFVRGKKGKVSGSGGTCLPLSLLTLHLGRLIGLPLYQYRMDSHVAAYLDAAGEIVYDPNSPNPLRHPAVFTKSGKAHPTAAVGSLFSTLFYAPTTHLNSGNDPQTAIRYLEKMRRLLASAEEDLLYVEKFLSVLYRKEKEPEKAEEAIRRTLKLFPDDYVALQNLALLLLARRSYDEALPVMTAATKRFEEVQRLSEISEGEELPGNRLRPRRIFLHRILKASLQWRKGDWEKARFLFKDAFTYGKKQGEVDRLVYSILKRFKAEYKRHQASD